MQVSVGGEFFEEIRNDGLYYVDKTDILYELINNTKNKVSLFTRPRRFGKTLMMTMMRSFFDVRRNCKNLFEGLKISEHIDFCKKYMNQYPTLFITLKDVSSLKFIDSYSQLRVVFSNICIEHEYLLDDEKQSAADLENFKHLLMRDSSVENCRDELVNGLTLISRMLYTHYGKPVILLIDEYDVPLDKANENGYYEEMLDVIRGILSTSLKTNDYIKFAVVTGCLRIAKESIFTGVNNFASYSVLDEEFSEYFGFSEDEVNELLNNVDYLDAAEMIKEWYDGYLFGSHEVFCPWDVVNYVSALINDKNAKPKNYWSNSSENGIVRSFVEQTDFDVTSEYEILLNGGSICKTICDDLTYDTLDKSEDNLWSVLLMTGYLTRISAVENDENTFELRIPNKEISGIFKKSVIERFERTIDQGEYNKLINALWNGDDDVATEAISELLWETISFYDYHEDYYHAFLIGLFSARGLGVESNREHGTGRTDVLIRDRSNRRAIIIEAKKADSEDAMDRACEDARKQIEEKQYFKGLAGYSQIRCYGIAFYQKTALVKELRI